MKENVFFLKFWTLKYVTQIVQTTKDSYWTIILLNFFEKCNTGMYISGYD